MRGGCGMKLSFFFNDTATTEIYTLSLHDALPIWMPDPPSSIEPSRFSAISRKGASWSSRARACCRASRSEEHTSELQSRQYLVCRLLLEKKNSTLLLPSLSPLSPSPFPCRPTPSL